VLRLGLEYDGAAFSGWAGQPGLRTVESEVTGALETLVRHPARLAVAGRTDAGVHARGQVASAVVRTALEPGRILRGLAGILPHDVAARAAEWAPAGFDARRDATARRYEYRFLVGPDSPLRRGRVHEVRRPLDVAAMRAAAASLEGRHDFSAFTPTRTDHVFFHRTVRLCRLIERGDELVLDIEADAFLRGMVRAIAGTLLEVGSARRPVASVASLLAGAGRPAAGPTLPAHGLTLTGVRYGVPPDPGLP
jgi:tRNA pseudouridine38-40 synthase